MTNGFTPAGFRYTNDDTGIANMLRSLAHGVASSSRFVNCLVPGRPVVGYVQDRVLRGCYVIIGMAVGTDGGMNPWGPEYDSYTIHNVRWMCNPIWVPADVAWGTSNNLSGEVLQQMLEYALSS